MSSHTKKNTLHLVCGQPGTGKTTWGKQLATSLNAAFLDIDICTEPVVVAGLSMARHDPCDRDSKQFKQHFRQPIYDALMAIAGTNISHMDVVISAPFTAELQQSDWPESLEQALNCQVEVYVLECDSEELKQRIITRNNPRDKAKLVDWKEYQRYFSAQQPKCRHQRVCTTNFRQ